MPHSYRERLTPGPKVRFWLLMAVLVWAPLPLGSYERWSMLLLSGLLCALGMWHFSAMALHATMPTRATRSAALPLGLLLAVAFWQLLQVPLVSVSSLYTLQFALLGFGIFAAALLVTELVVDHKRATILLWTLIGSATFQGAYGAAMVLTGMEYGFFEPKRFNLGWATGTLFNRNHLAAYLVVGLALGIALMLSQLSGPAKNWRDFLRKSIDALLSPKALLRILLIIMVIGLIMTRSRMGNMGFMFMLLSTAALWFLTTRKLSRGALVFLISVVVIDLWIVGAVFGAEQVVERVTQSSVGGDDRIQVNQSVGPMLREHWVTGIGAGTFWLVFPGYREEGVGAFYYNAHNDYAQVLIEMGLPGAICLGGFWLLCLIRTARMLRSHNQWYRSMAFGGVMISGYVALHATVEFNLYIPAVALTFVAVLTFFGLVVPSLREADIEASRG